MTELEQTLVRDSEREGAADAQESRPGQCSLDLSGAGHGHQSPPQQQPSKCLACTPDTATMRQRRRQLVHGSTLRGDTFVMPTGSPEWWPWRGRCAEQHRLLSGFLEARATHVAVIVLVMLDLAIVATELILSSTYCEGEMPHAVHVAEVWLRWVSIAILCLFMLELLLKLAVFGLAYYISSWFHMLDAVVVTSSLVLELALHGVAQEVAALLVFFRLWRILRIMHSVTEVLEMNHEEHLEEHHKLMEEMQKKLALAWRQISKLEAELEHARGQAAAPKGLPEGQGSDYSPKKGR